MDELVGRLREVGGARGFSMLEIITVLGVIAIMGALLMPMVLGYVEDAKRTRAEAEVKNLGGLIVSLAKDVQTLPMYYNGQQTFGDPDIWFLLGPGNDPDDTGPTPWGLKNQGAKVDQLENHLVKNNPGGAAMVKPYATSGRTFWKGPYTEKIGADPWGNRYVVNIKNGNPGDKPAKVIWVLSPGPNGKVETDGEATTDTGPVPGGDDIAARIR